MRILYIVDGHYPAVGGAELQAGMLSRQLQDKGHQVLVICPRLRAEQSLDDEIQGVRVQRLDYPKVPYCQSLFLVLAFMGYMWRRRNDFDAIHVHMVNWFAPVLGFLKPKISAVVVAKFSGATEFDTGVLDLGLRNTWLHRIKNHYIRKLDYFQVLSKYTRQRLLDFDYDSEKIIGIPNGVNLARFQATEPSTDAKVMRLGFCGRIVPVKGLDVLLQAMAPLIVEERLDIQLHLAGSGPERPALESLSQDLGLQDRVHFLGSLEDVGQLLARIDVYLQPSYQEGLPNSVIEAMAAQRAVIASRISGNEDVVQHELTGLLFESGDVVGLRDALRKLYFDVPLRVSMGREGRRVIESQFKLERIVEALESLFRRNAAPQTLAQSRKQLHER